MSDSGEAAASDAHDRPNWLVYPAESYQFREESLEIGRGLIFETANEIIKKRIRAYNRVGLRVTVCGVILCHRNGFPHIIVLRDSEGRLGLLGGKCKAYDGPEEALRQKLARFVSTSRKGTLQLDLRANADNVVVGELLGEFWRPEYDSDILPYLPLHVNRPREKILVYQVNLREQCAFVAPNDMQILPMPLHDFYRQEQGLAMSALPHLLTRFNLSLMHHV